MERLGNGVGIGHIFMLCPSHSDVDVPSEDPTHAPEDNIPSAVKVAASRLATCWLLLTFTGMKNINLLLSMLGIRRVTFDISILR